MAHPDLLDPRSRPAPDRARPLPRLHVLTDTCGGRDPWPEVRAVVRAGVGRCAVQVRAKELSDREAFALASRVVELAHPAGVLVLLDDRFDLALAAGADGVHLGASDLPVAAVRAMAPPGFLVGATARDAAGALEAHTAGADYLGVGPVHATRTKAGLPAPLGARGLAAVASATPLPVLAIGGIDADRVAPVLAAGAHGVAVVTAVSRVPRPDAAVQALLRALAAAPAPSPPPIEPPTPRASAAGNGPVGDAS